MSDGQESRAGIRVLVVMLGLAALSACAATPHKSAESSPLKVVEQYLSALNRRDLLMLTAYVTPDVAWYSMVKGERLQEVAGRAALTETLRGYFAQNQQTQWTIELSTTSGQKVAVRERSQWQAGEEQGARVSLVVYELRDGRIACITYFLDSP